MSPASMQFEEAANKWAEAGRPRPEAPEPYEVMRLYCWSGSAGGRKDGLSDALKAHLQALRSELERQDPGWYDRLLSSKDYCDRCGESYRLENVSICTYCSTTFAPCHPPHADYWENGNRQCPSCRKGEIVG